MKVELLDEAVRDLLGYHRMLARRFPFAIYYRVLRKTAKVYAVLDCRRDPAWIRDRLE